MPLPDETPARNRAARTIWLLVAVLAVVALSGFAWSTTSSACSSCHAMQPFVQGHASGAHKNVDCFACHAASALDRLRFATVDTPSMIAAAASGRGVDGPGVQVSRAACLACHTRVLQTRTNANGLRIDHKVCAATGRCDTCHATVGHGDATRYKRTYVMEACVSCHIVRGAPKNCDLCHAGQLEQARLAQGSWQVTHGPSWRTTHGAWDLTYCQTCHDKSYCSKCHKVDLPHPADFGTTHGAAAKKTPAACATCHDRTRFCDSCHGLQMPHPADFLARHPQIAKSTSAPACLRCHQQSDCDACHTKHIHPGSTQGTLSGASLPTVKQ